MKTNIQNICLFFLLALTTTCTLSNKAIYLSTTDWHTIVKDQMKDELFACNNLYYHIDTLALLKHRYLQFVEKNLIEQQIQSIKPLLTNISKKDALLLATTKIGYGYNYNAEPSTFLYINHNSRVQMYHYDAVQIKFVKYGSESQAELKRYYNEALNCSKQVSNCGNQVSIYTQLNSNLNIIQIKSLINNCP
jgi:hypothetical protein